MIDFEVKCIMCGGDLEKVEDKSTCPNCSFDEFNQVSKSDMSLIAEGLDKLSISDYKSAYDLFSKFVKKHTDMAVGYFGLVLAKYYVREYSLDSVTLDMVRADSIYSDVDYTLAIKYAKGNLREYITKVAGVIDSKSRDILALASHEKPYEIAVLGDNTDEIYKYLDNVGYDVYSESIPSTSDVLADKFNVLSNSKTLVLSIESEETLDTLSKSILVCRYQDNVLIGDKADNSLVVVSSLDSSKVLEYIPEAYVINADKKTVLFDIENVCKSTVHDIVAPKASTVKHKPKTDTKMNVAGFNTVMKGLGIASIVLFVIISFMYMFTGNYYLVMGVVDIVLLGFSIALFVLSTVVFVRATRSAKHMTVMVISAFAIIFCMIGIGSAFFSGAGAEWCYRGYWYEITEDDTIEITNVDYYYTLVSRNIEVPDMMLGKKVVSFSLTNHSDIYSVVSVSEYLENLTIDNCNNLTKVSISTMSANANSITIDSCAKLKNLTIKNSHTLSLTLVDLKSLDNITMKSISVIKSLKLDNLDSLKELWFPVGIQKLTGFVVTDMGKFSVYSPSTPVGNAIHPIRGFKLGNTIREGDVTYTVYVYTPY